MMRKKRSEMNGGIKFGLKQLKKIIKSKII